MTDLLTSDHADSGEILRFHPSVLETARLDLGEGTRNIAPYAHGLRPRLRRPDTSGVRQVYCPQTMAVVDEPAALQEPTIPPPRPLPSPNPPPVPAARPWFYRRRHGLRELRPAWAYLVAAGLGSVGTAVVELAGIAALAVLR